MYLTFVSQLAFHTAIPWRKQIEKKEKNLQDSAVSQGRTYPKLPRKLKGEKRMEEIWWFCQEAHLLINLVLLCDLEIPTLSSSKEARNLPLKAVPKSSSGTRLFPDYGKVSVSPLSEAGRSR